MYLKSIEVHGFKSFANKIVFEFHNGITAIVGPNGSGKSNVADAVRWVLGEQKVKQLRSSNMQDVIFSGTENRRPLSYASVTITLDNSDHALPVDYHEVTVGRRVYRSGESEYLLNGSSCRLRDIHELFYDTGIGKEGYSIIGQGQIDRILSGKPEERRELFDEAAGIVKYKRRKQTTEKKLENERQNLSRVQDILSELEKQIDPLKRQSETAKIYLAKRDELRMYEVNRYLAETEEVQTRKEKLDADRETAETGLREAKQEFEEIRGVYESAEQKIDALEKEIGRLTEERSENKVQKEKTEGQLALLTEQIRTAQRNSEIQNHRLSILKDDLARCQEERKGYEEKQENFSEEIARIIEKKEQQYVKISEIRNRIAECESVIDDCGAELIELLNRKVNRQGEETRLQTLLEQAQARREALGEQIARQTDSKVRLEDTRSRYQKEYEAIAGTLNDLCRKEEELGQKLDSWREKQERTSQSLEDTKNRYHRDHSRLESLRNIAERYDGYGNSIRRVMEQKSCFPGICGVVADILKVEKTYETAIETALGGSIQNIVTEDEETAKELIAFLKEHRYGRATFLPLTSVRRRDSGIREDVLSEAGVIGYADTLVQTQPRFRPVAGNLLGRTLVVDQIDHAVSLQRKYRYSLRIVTLEGELLQPGGSMTGGAFKNSSNLLGRSREISQLKSRVQEEKETLDAAAARLEEIRTARALLKEDLSDVRTQIQETKLKENTIRMKLSRSQEETEQQKELETTIQRETEEIAEQIGRIRAEQKKLSEDSLGAVRREEELHEVSDRHQELLDEWNETYRREQNRQSDILMEEAAIRQKEDYLTENLERLDAEFLKLSGEQEELTVSVGAGRAEIIEKQSGIQHCRDLLALTAGRDKDLEAALRKLQEEKESAGVSHRDYFQRREEVSERIADLDREVFRLKNQMEKLEETLETQAAHLWEEYELTPHAAAVYRNPELPGIGVMKKQIASLREEIRTLGNVNVNAIEEYKQVSGRYEFLSAQKEDIVASEEALMKMIADLEEGMRRQFHEKFADIQTEFNRAFQELFGGGKGTLELTDGEDELDSGVSIIAQPPGKKLQNMMQLSGGEKALTAIALLFAIQNLKPSPFCLLDEIEAALDDSNVGRFAAYLKKLSKNTQFILITHRRGTMLAADRLYGITMQEKGVSTQVSVDLIEKQLDD